ncbi:MAG: TIGR01777 family oxidoreductase [Bacteriovorax sp.]|nr:TIGR01777 family oxidoreductase [Bacteriovorax sp.]
MKILITGATGFVGKKLTAKLLSKGFEINILTRDALKAKALFPQAKVFAFEWKNNLELPPLESIQGISGVINLMGENIAAKRWSDEQKKILKESRVDSTQNLVKLIESHLASPLDFFISSSAVGIYPVNSTKTSNEDSIPGNGFLAELCKQWEAASDGLTKTKRKVIIRTGVVLEKSDGALKKMLPPFQLGLGGPIGDGNQVMSWIELDDLVNLYASAATDEKFSGIYNGVAPTPVNNFDFTKALGHALHRPTIFPVPTLPLKLAFGEMASVILDSQSVVSKRLPELGFHFQYETIESALNAIFHK